MRARLILTVSGVAILVLAAMAGSVRGAPQSIPFAAMSEYDLAQLGLDFKPLPATSAPAAVSATEAQSVASRVLGNLPGDVETKRVIAQIRPGEPPRSVWVISFAGGSVEAVPHGPVGEDGNAAGGPLKPRFSGALIDDATGEILITFTGGSQ